MNEEGVDSMGASRDYERIEQLAYELKFEELTPIQQQKKESELFSLLLRVINITDVFAAGIKLQAYDEKAKATNEKIPENIYDTLTSSECCGLEVVMDTFEQAWKLYGTGKYLKDGVPVSFGKIFFRCFNFIKISRYSKAYNSFFEENDKDFEYWRRSLKGILNKYAMNRGIAGYKAPDNIINFEKLRDELLKFGYEEEEATRQTLCIFEAAPSLISLYNYDDGNKSTYIKEIEKEIADSKEQMDDDNDKSVIMIVEVYDLVQKDTEISKTDKKYVRYFLTVQIVKHNLEDNYKLKRILIRNLVEFAREEKNKDKTINVILAEYLKKQPDTIRKNMKAVQYILLDKKREVCCCEER